MIASPMGCGRATKTRNETKYKTKNETRNDNK